MDWQKTIGPIGDRSAFNRQKTHKINTKTDQQKGTFQHEAQGQKRQWELPLPILQYFASLKQCPLVFASSGCCWVAISSRNENSELIEIAEINENAGVRVWQNKQIFTRHKKRPSLQRRGITGDRRQRCNLSTLFDIHPLSRIKKSSFYTDIGGDLC